MHAHQLLLLADWTEIIGFLVVVAFGVLRYFLTEMGEGKQKKAAPPQRRPQPRPGARPAGAQGDLRVEVEDFLRRAQGLPERKAERSVDLQPADDPPSRLSDRRPAMTPVEMEQAEGLPDVSVAEHVSQHLRHLEESQLAENAAKLGEEVALADDKVRARIDAKFKHSLGRLDRGGQQLAEVPQVDQQVFGADQVAAMLSSPDGFRNAIILNEILQRPTDRW